MSTHRVKDRGESTMRLLPLLVVLFVAALAGYLPVPARAAQGDRVVAIIPFEKLSPRPDDEYLPAGFAETLTTALSRVQGLQLIERGQLKRVLEELKIQSSGLVDQATAVKLGKLVGAKQLVLGAFQRNGAVMRVTCRLVDTETGVIDAQHTITETATLAEDADLFTLQDAVCKALLRTFSIQPTPQERTQIIRIINATTNRTAFDLYIQAREQYLYFTTEGYAQAAFLFKRALEADPNYALALAGLAETLALWGYQKEQNGENAAPNYAAALAYAKRAVALGPGSADAHRALAEAYAHTSERGPADHAQWTQEARRAVEINPRDDRAYVLLWCALGKPLQGEGYAYIQVALNLNPRNGAAWNDLGVALASNGRLDEGVAALRRATTVSPRSASAYSCLGKALGYQGRLDEAVSAYRRAIEISPRHAIAHHGLADALRCQGKLDEAITAYRQALDINPRSGAAWNDLGIALHDQGKMDEAVAAYQQALAINPHDANAHLNLGVVLAAEGRMDEAVAAYQRAISTNPRDADAYNNLGVALAALGRPAEAIAAYHTAIRANPRHASAYLNLGVALKEQGKRGEAIVAIRKCLELGTDDPAQKRLVAKAQATLKELDAR